ncbi:STAS domain-containing protein [Chromobacterium sp. IIBBL 290-4]|uniref:STAS domain-containing protein n=1 Tax=Chromobacterium sp. IIBBL 290-4 TaxID=2953890 RepID=UPI0020B7F4B4|nr:STAS domain-containing protein [Chromobacterium sp. IIBBL 290-4]UTH76128.1 STAS domain-containing protein [Chromobacterium sp. IIBBL 290-4]
MLETLATGQAALKGRIDMANSGALAAPLRRLAAQGPLRLDLSAVEAADSAAVALLLAAHRAARAAGHALTLAGAPDNVRALAGLYGLQALLFSETE